MPDERLLKFQESIYIIDTWRAGDEETENYTYAIALQNDT